jgi:hypothetical protein
VHGLANAIRRDGDGLVQTRGRTTGPENAQVSVAGSAHVFILPINEKRDQRIAQVRMWAADKTGDPAWRGDEGEDSVKLLVIVHRMAATRFARRQTVKRLEGGKGQTGRKWSAATRHKENAVDATSWRRAYLRTVCFCWPTVDLNRSGPVVRIPRSRVRHQLSAPHIGNRPFRKDAGPICIDFLFRAKSENLKLLSFELDEFVGDLRDCNL